MDKLHCLRCGYDLAGLDITGNCPECGVPIEHSMRGNRLEYSDPGYLSKLRTGTKLILWGFGAIILSVIINILGAIMLSTGMSPVLLQIGPLLEIAASVLGLAGWWLLSSPDPAFIGLDPGGKSRVILRVTLVIMSGGFVANTVLDFFFPTLGAGMNPNAPAAVAGNMMEMLIILAGALGGIASLVKFFASMRYLILLAGRFPDEQLAERVAAIRKFIVTLVLIGVIAAVVFGVLAIAAGALASAVMIVVFLGLGIAYIIWAIRYISMIYRFSTNLAYVRTIAFKADRIATLP